jgi:protein involved in polysaccharide export with SLBB domain/beta-lactamase regulating signal transducer with metallopeptidase domain
MNLASVVTMIDPEITRRIAIALVHSTWQGAAAVIVLAGVLRAMRHHSANTRYVLACAMLAAIFAATLATFILAGRSAHSSAATRSGDFSGNVAQIVRESGQAIELGAPGSSSLVRFAVAAWVIGVGTLSLWQMGGWCWLHLIRREGKPAELDHSVERLTQRMGIRQKVRVLEAKRIESPVVMGVWRPVVLIPVGFMAGLAPAQVEAILAHELAHIRRWDYLANLVQCLIETLLFYHPCVWWISAQIRQEREHCCDDIAATIAGDAVAYAETLVMLEGRRTPRLALAAGGGMLSRRVRRLIGAPAPRRPKRRSAIVGILAAACVIALVMNHVAPAQTEKIVKAAVAATTNASSSILPEDLVAEPQDYRIGPNDLVQVSITGLVGPGVETVKTARVGEKSGEISLPLVGYIRIAGLTAAQAERAIAEAYKKALLLENAQVSVQVAEQRGNTFSILGAVGRPGEYSIAKSDFRLLDALVLGGAQPGQLGKLTILRKQATGAPRRIEVPVTPLMDGDPQYNVVIHPGDLITTSEPAKRFFRVIVDRDAIFVRLDGSAGDKKTDWNSVDNMLSAMKPAERRSTVLEIGVASKDLPVGDFFQAQATASDLVKKYELAHLSDVGVQTPKKATVGVYYMGGHLQRAGVYSLSGTGVILKQAIIAAGMQDKEAKFVQVIRRNDNGERTIVNATLDEKLSDPKLDMAIEPNDTVMVTDQAPKGK